MDQIEVTAPSLCSLTLAKTFPNSPTPVTTRSFSRNSRYLFASTEALSLHIYDVSTGSLSTLRTDSALGIRLVTPTHHPHTVLYANSTGEQPTIAYYDWPYNLKVWTTNEPTRAVAWLGLAPAMDGFLCLSRDEKARFFDLRQRKSVFSVDFETSKDSGCAAFDPSGTVFALCVSTNRRSFTHLYDIRRYQSGAYLTRELPGRDPASYCEFSDDGVTVLVGTTSSTAYVLDSMSLAPKTVLRFPHDPEACYRAVFSACSQYVLAGSDRHRNLAVYDRSSGETVCEMQRTQPTTALAWNKDYLLVAAAADEVDLWLPEG